MWFETRLDPDSRHYNLLWEASITGPLEPEQFGDVLKRLTARHPSMRTRFREEAGEALSVVAAELEVPWTFEDLRGLPPDDVERRLQDGGERLAGDNFDLTQGPLFGFRLSRVGDQEHRLWMVAHHMVADGFSWPILLREIVVGLAGGEWEPLQANPADVANWQREYLGSEAGREAERYWRSAFPEAPAMPEIPGQSTRPAALDRIGVVRITVVPPDVMERVRGCARAHGTSVFRTLLAAFGAVLHRWTGDAEVVIGTTLLGRTMLGAERVVGFLNNVAAVRLVVSRGGTFEDWMRTTHEVVAAAAANQEYPFAKLASGWRGGRASNRLGLTAVSFTKLPARKIEHHGGFRVWERRVYLDRSPHELAFYVQETGVGADLICEFNPILYPAAVIERLVGQYLLFLEAATACPDVAVVVHSLVRREDSGILPDPAAVLERPFYQRVTEALDNRWWEFPELPAVRQDGREWTYEALAGASARIAERIDEAGIAVGSVVAVTGVRSFGLIAGIVGVWRAGCVMLTLDPNLPLQRRRVMLEQAGASGILGVSGNEALDVSELIEERPDMRIVEVGGDGTLAGGGGTVGTGTGSSDRMPSGDAAYLFFTSGTTGAPKAVRGSHAGLGHFLAWQRTTFGIGPGDRAAQLTGLSFDVVLRDMFTPLTGGATLCLPPAGEEHLAGRLLAWLGEEKVTLLHSVPSLAQAWLEQAPEARPLAALRLTFFAGEPLTQALVQRWRVICPSTRVLNLYGPTETTLAKCWHEVGPEPDAGIQPVGRPQPQTQAWVLNEARALCGIGEPGEIVIRTPFRSLGYANSPEETARRFVPNPYRADSDDLVYLTGDRGRYRADGVLEILGRMDFQVKVRGVRIELNEVTAALATHPEVQSTVVIAREDEPGRKYLVGYVVARGSAADLPWRLTDHLRRLLPAAFVPEAIVVLDRLPLTPNGKVDRKALPAPVRPERVISAVEPRNLTERQVMDLMRELLRDGRLGPEDNFFEAGGHSLLALQLMAGIRKLLGVEVSLRVLFEQPTAVAVARAVDEARARQSGMALKSVTPLNLGDVGRPALFIFTGGNGGDRELYVHSYLAQKWLGGRRPVYGLRMRGWDGSVAPHADIRTMARDYIGEIRSVQPKGPFFLLGDCTGGNIAFETACQLQGAGENVPLLLLTDCIRPRWFEYGRFVAREMWRRWRMRRRGGGTEEERRRNMGGADEEATSSTPSVDAPGEEYWTQLGRHYRRVITSNRPGRFVGRLHLVVSQGRARDGRILRWGECATDGATVTELPDNHWLYLWHHGDRIGKLLEEAERLAT